MAFSRHNNDLVFNDRMGSASKVSNIRAAVQDGSLQITLYTTKEGERLDQIAGKFYGDGRYWWVICLLNDTLKCLLIKPKIIHCHDLSGLYIGLITKLIFKSLRAFTADIIVLTVSFNFRSIKIILFLIDDMNFLPFLEFINSNPNL